MRKLRNHRYSLRAFAHFLGIGSSTLSRILMNTQEISNSNSKLIRDKLNFKENESMLFIASIAEEKRKRAFGLISNMLDGVDSPNVDPSEFHSVNSDWLLAKSPEIIFVVNKLFQCIYANDVAAKLHNRTPQELIGLTMSDAGVPEVVVKRVEAYVLKTFNEKKNIKNEDEYPTENGIIWMERIYIPIFGKNNEVNAVACHARDISDRKQVEGQLRFLVDIGKILSSSYDFKATLRTMVEMITSKLADGCFIHIMNENHDVEVFKVAHKEIHKEEILSTIFAKYPYDPNFPNFYHNVFNTDKLQFFPVVNDDMIKKVCRNEEHYKTLKVLEVISYLCVPMKANSKVIGTMTLLRSSGQSSFDLNDLILVKEVCSRAAWTIDCAMKLSPKP